jgi:hypothetical protein
MSKTEIKPKSTTKSQKKDIPPGVFFSSKDLIKATMRHIIFRHGRLTAKEIQDRLGLKRQTTYSYLNELVDDEKIEIKYEKLEDRPNLNIAYYSNKKCTDCLDQKKDKKDLNVSYTEKMKKKLSGLPYEEKITKVTGSIDTLLAALLEVKTHINKTMDEKTEGEREKALNNYLDLQSDLEGFLSGLILLTDDEYNELLTEMKVVLNRFWQKSVDNEQVGSHSGHTFFYGFFKNF